MLQQWAVVFTGGTGLTTEGILNHLNAYVEKGEASALNCVNMLNSLVKKTSSGSSYIDGESEEHLEQMRRSRWLHAAISERPVCTFAGTHTFYGITLWI